MKKFAGFVAAGLMLLVIQSVWNSFFDLRSGPQFLFILVVFSGIYHRFFGGLLLAFLFGFAVDTLWGLLPGLYAFIYALTFVASRLAGRRFYMRSFPFQVLIVLVLTLFAQVLEWAILAWLGDFAGLGRPHWGAALRLLLWNTLLAVPVVGLLERLEQSFTDVYASQFTEHRGIL